MSAIGPLTEPCPKHDRVLTGKARSLGRRPDRAPPAYSAGLHRSARTSSGRVADQSCGPRPAAPAVPRHGRRFVPRHRGRRRGPLRRGRRAPPSAAFPPRGDPWSGKQRRGCRGRRSEAEARRDPAGWCGDPAVHPGPAGRSAAPEARHGPPASRGLAVGRVASRSGIRPHVRIPRHFGLRFDAERLDHPHVVVELCVRKGGRTGLVTRAF